MIEEESNNFSLDSDDLSSDDIEVSEVKNVHSAPIEAIRCAHLLFYSRSYVVVKPFLT